MEHPLHPEGKRTSWLADHITLPIAVAIAVLAALFIVALAYWLYWEDDNRKYDIARAGQQTTNRITEDEVAAVDVTSPVSREEIEKKKTFLQEEVIALDKIDGFEPEDLNDTTIQFVAPPAR